MGLNIEVPLAEFEANADSSVEEIKSTHGGSVNFGIVGVGQAGGQIAKSFYDLGYKNTVIINTAKVDLDAIDIPENQKVYIDAPGKSGTTQDGAGKDMRKGEEAVKVNSQEIFDAFKRSLGKVDHIIVCLGFGGGTGCGGAALTIQIAKKYVEHLQIGNPSECVGVIATLPTAGEYNSCIIRANTREGLGAIGRMARAKEISTLLLIDNDKINKIYRGLTVKQFWPVVNKTISVMFHAFNKLTTISSPYASFDASDYRTIIQCGGCCVMGHASIKNISDATDISKALTTNIQKNLLAANLELESAKFAGCIAVGSSEAVASVPGLMDMLNYGFDSLSNLIGQATLHRGIYEDNEAKELLQVFTIIGGMKPPSKTLISLGANVQQIWPGEG